MIKNYPKKRNELPEAYKAIYSEHYKKNRDGKTTATTLSKRMESWMHKKVAADVRYKINKSTLEIGAGTLNHLKFEQSQPYDIVEPFKELFIESRYLSRISKIYDDISEIGTMVKYDRIISIATFEHILDLPSLISSTCLLLQTSGCLRVAIPNEGELLWKLGWKLTTGIEFKIKYDLDYEILMKYEHVNTANEIEELLEYFYHEVNCSYLGVSKKIAFYRFYECREPNVELAKKILKLN